LEEKMKSSRELTEELAAKQARLAKVFEEAGSPYDFTKSTDLTGDLPTRTAEVQRLLKELEDIGKQRDEAKGLEDAHQRVTDMGKFLNDPATSMRHPSPADGGGGQRQATKSLGEFVIEHAEFKATAGHARKTFSIEQSDVEFKTLFQTTAGFPPETMRTGRVVEAALRPIGVLDIIPSTPTDQAAVVYMRETVTTVAAAERAEAGVYAEAEISYAEDSSTVRSIGVSLPVTDEQLEDVPGVQGMIDGRLLFFLRQRLDGQVLNGSGGAPNLRGILNAVTIQTQAKGADPVFDAIHKAITLVMVTGRAVPNAIIMNPNDWQDLRLTRTADGIYILGNPADVGAQRLWGLPVVVTDALAENTGLVGDFANHCELRPRRAAEVQVGYDADDFTHGIQTIRAGLRTAFVVYRATAFCSISGI
jgi:HK97 family phage major capsid protein